MILHRTSPMPEPMGAMEAMDALRALSAALNDDDAGGVEDGVEDAETALLLGHTRFVLSVAKRYFVAGSDDDKDDLWQEALWATVYAIRCFDIATAAALSHDAFNGDGALHSVFLTYLRKKIEGACGRWKQQRFRAVRLPRHVEERIVSIRKASRLLGLPLEPASYPAIAAWLNERGGSVTAAMVAEAMQLQYRTAMAASLNAQFSNDHSHETWLDRIADTADAGYDAIDDGDEHRWQRSVVNDMLAVLNEHQRTVVALYHGFDGSDGRSCREVGALIGRSGQTVDQTLKRAYSVMTGTAAAYRYRTEERNAIR